MHELEIQAIADGDIAYNILGVSPVANGQLSEEEIKRCEADEKAVLVATPLEKNVKERNAKAKKVLSPTQRAEKPNAILWIIKNCPEVIDSQICKLIGTTKPTIASIREGTHGNMANLRPVNPMAVGLCSEKELEKAMLISQQQIELKESRGKKKSKKKATKKAAQQNRNGGYGSEEARQAEERCGGKDCCKRKICQENQRNCGRCKG